MANSSPLTAARPYRIAPADLGVRRESAGRALIVFASLGLAAILLLQILHKSGATELGFQNWRPLLYAYLAWAVALGAGQVMIRGEAGHRALFVRSEERRV